MQRLQVPCDCPRQIDFPTGDDTGTQLMIHRRRDKETPPIDSEVSWSRFLLERKRWQKIDCQTFCSQSSTRSRETRPNSATLLVARVIPLARAMAAIWQCPKELISSQIHAVYDQKNES